MRKELWLVLKITDILEIWLKAPGLDIMKNQSLCQPLGGIGVDEIIQISDKIAK